MDYGSVISDSIAFTREALNGTWVTWFILALCGLTISLPRIILDRETFAAGGTLHWDIFPWTWIVVIFVVGLFSTLLVFGYIVRIYRGAVQPPVFDAWASLFMDGIRLMVLSIIWLLPAVVILSAGAGLLAIGLNGKMPLASGASFTFIGLILLLLGFIVLVISLIFSTLGCVRFARTGSIREGLRLTAISGVIQAIGWGNYIFMLVINTAFLLVCLLVIVLLCLIPVGGAVLSGGIVFPFAQIFFARYISRVYDHGVPTVPATDL